MPAKYEFIEHYPGPHGAHLSCLTMFTKTRDETKRGGTSIRGEGNTCAMPNRDVLRRKIAAVSDHCDRHPNSRTSEAHLAKLQSPRLTR